MCAKLQQKAQSTGPWCCWDAQQSLSWCPWDSAGAGSRASIHLSLPALTHLPGLLPWLNRICSVFWYQYVQHVLLLSGSPWHEDHLVNVFRKNSLKLSMVAPVHVRRWTGSLQKWGTGYMGCLFHVPGTLTVHFFTDCPGRLAFCQSRLMARHPQNIVPNGGMDWACKRWLNSYQHVLS